MKKPIAVLISDVHYNLKNLQLADTSMRKAIDTAKELSVPLIIAGDLHDTKAIIRAECMNAMLATFIYANRLEVNLRVLVGNHDLINEKGHENALVYLGIYSYIVVEPSSYKGFNFIPYQSSPELFLEALNKIPKGSTVIAHQGVTEADMGEYVVDHSAVPKEALADYRIISGHYHKAQNIKCGRPKKGSVGLMSYIGSPYTMSFAEANDGPKGFQVLFEDGTMQQQVLNLRKHVVIECNASEVEDLYPDLSKDDLLWLKVSGTYTELEKLDKSVIGSRLIGHSNFKLDKIVTDPDTVPVPKENQTASEIMDSLVDSRMESEELRTQFKAAWRKVMK